MWQNPEIFCRIENLAQNWEFWPLQTSKGWNLTKSRKILICVANLTQKWDWPLWTCGGWNLAWNFQSRWKFQGRIQVWAESAPAPLLTAKLCKFSRFWGYISYSAPLYKDSAPLFLQILNPALNLAWNQEFDHSWPAKDEILQNQEIFDMCQKFSSKLTFVTQHKQMRDMLARAMCTKVKICQILDNDLLHIFFMIHIFSGMETWPEKLVYMLCCLFVSLTCLLNEMFTCLKYGFFNSWNSNKSI